METIILASSSPRRKEILASLNLPFIPIHPDIDEAVCDHLDPAYRVIALAEKKSAAGLALLESEEKESELPRLLLAADTLVAFHHARGWKTIGKPRDRDEARSMLLYMEGRTHRVFSGLCLLDVRNGRRHTTLATTKVRFSNMSGMEIERYLDTGEWEGAAGAYRVQGAGSCFITSLVGSWSCVVGLPIRELYGILRDADYDFGVTGRS
ncbi:MAG: septum formation protein Maf [Spirochaetae bacterium HGW-Spirochaetae-9]|nr:MAG: septum formation protein Maf [Spirochaetae bacterium HGW-Spirochaetae-9]